MTANEQELIAASKRGNLEAFSQLVKYHQAAVRACLAVRLNHSHEAEDLAQEVFVLAFRKLNEFDAAYSFGAWLRGIALNLLRNYQRKMQPLPVGALEELQALVEQQVEASHAAGGEADWLAAMRLCLERLDPFSRQLVRARYEDDAEVAEICRSLGKKHSAVTMQLHRIRQQLRACVEQNLDPA